MILVWSGDLVRFVHHTQQLRRINLAAKANSNRLQCHHLHTNLRDGQMCIKMNHNANLKRNHYHLFTFPPLATPWHHSQVRPSMMQTEIGCGSQAAGQRVTRRKMVQ